METSVCENDLLPKELPLPFFPEYPDVLDMKQVGEMLGVCVKTVYRLIQNDELKSVRIGRQHRIAKLHLMQYMNIGFCEE